MKINVPEKVEYIIRTLKSNGYEAYAVGGCIRDSILGREPGDWDITTSASPFEVKEIFHRTIDTGIQHGTVTVMLEKEGFEVTTYRLDGEYEDCRHPKQVEFTKSLEEDLKRRDFTINAMAYNEEDGMVDMFDGLGDIQRKSIRCVGNAMDRFEEDALRILRAVRFSAQIDFEIEKDTKEAICRKAKNLSNISAERIREEFNKLFLSQHPEKLIIAYETGITNVVLNEFDQKMAQNWEKDGQRYNCGDLVLAATQAVSDLRDVRQKLYGGKDREVVERNLTSKERLCLSYASLLWNPASGSEAETQESDALAAKKVMQRLKFDNETINCVTKLVRFSHAAIKEEEIGMRRAMNTMGTDLMDLWFLFQQVILAGMDQSYQKARRQQLDHLYRIYCKVMDEKQCVCLKELKINGKDLIGMGCQPGVTIGTLLDQLLQHVLEFPQDNEIEALKQLAANEIIITKP